MSDDSLQNQGIGARMRKLASGHGSPAAGRAYTIIYTLVITALFAAAVGGINEALRARKARIARAAKQQVIIDLLELKFDTKTPNNNIDKFYSENVEEKSIEVEGATVKYFVQKSANGTSKELCVLPVTGRGFWGPIYGYLAMDLKTGKINGLKFTAHEETPGLGGRIDEKWFTEQFVGLPVLDNPAGERLSIVRGGAKDKTKEVDAITGATGTSSAVDALLNSAIDTFAKAVKK